MIISHKHQFIFIHIPKCAGTSITRALLPHLGSDDIVFGCTPELEQKSAASLASGGLFKHSTALEIKRAVNPTIWSRYYKVSFVRNPWDAILSRFYWWKKNAPGWSDDVLQTTIERSGLQLKGKTLQELTFQEFIYAISDYSRYPYEGFLRDETQESCCDFVGRFERLENDFDTVCTHLKIAGAQLPLTNTSAEMRTTSSYVDEYDSSSAQLIEQVFAREIKKYGYRFGPVFDETLV